MLVKFNLLIDGLTLKWVSSNICLLLLLYVTNNHELGGLKSHKCITFLFWRSGVQNGLIEPQSICWQGWLFPEALQGSPSATYTGHLYSFVHNPLCSLEGFDPTLTSMSSVSQCSLLDFLSAHGVALACIREDEAIWLFFRGNVVF